MLALCMTIYHSCFHLLYALRAGLPIAGRIAEPGFLEGGDFFPMGQDLALVGVGLRSNVEACQQLMDRDLLGTRRLGVVRDDFDRDQVSCCGYFTQLLAGW